MVIIISQEFRGVLFLPEKREINRARFIVLPNTL